ncbi:hypothetical protein B0H12DRAFT_282692 [Mycena haematopus]|nr:hypothetical protein B0H12DRAFT_282692 [Mycena haematopus]
MLSVRQDGTHRARVSRRGVCFLASLLPPFLSPHLALPCFLSLYVCVQDPPPAPEAAPSPRAARHATRAAAWGT